MRRFIIAWIVFIQGCTLATVNVEVMSERTALENQVLGTYNSLDREMLLAASVRGVDASGKINAPPQKSRGQKDAVEAMQTMDFHGDDIRQFKALGWIGENRMGFLEIFEIKDTAVPEELKDFAKEMKKEEFTSVVSRVNQARKIIMERVIDMNENLSREDIDQVREIFARLNAEKALPGDKIQTGEGSWTVKK